MPNTSEKPATLQDEASAWTEQTKRLGATAWDATKEATGQIGEDSKALLEKTQNAAGDALESAREKSGELVDSVKNKSQELLESAKQKSSELYESTKKKGAELLDQQPEEPARKPAIVTET